MHRKRYFINLNFEGSNYHGWQFQPNAISVQQKLEESLAVLYGEKISVMGCGRTDTGVHATDFYAHCDLSSKKFTNEKLKQKLNHLLPIDIAIKNVHLMQDDAHARFHATSREYRYYLYQQKNPFLRSYSSYYSRGLNLEMMKEAGKLLFNHKDFTSFSKLHTDVKTNDCTILNFEINELSDGRIEFVIEANRFLRNMVRSIVGTLLEVGVEKISVIDFNNVILSKNRCVAGASAPANGLFLSKVNYPPELFINE